MTPFPHGPRWRTRLAVGIAAALAASTGCLHHKHDKCDGCGKKHGGWWHNCSIDKCADIPAGAIPTHPGTYTNAYVNKQADKAEVHDFVINYNEWKDKQATLGPHGRAHLAQMIARLPTVPFPVIVQPSPDHLQATTTPENPEDKVVDVKALNETRRQVIVDLLVKANVPDARERVVLGIATAEGLFGEEGERIYPQLNQNLGGGGGGAAGALSAFGGGFGGGGIR